MTQKVRWGVIGSGGIARRRTIPEGLMPSDSAELVAVYDIDSELNQQVAQEFGCAHIESVEELASHDIQAVYVASPAAAHYEQVLMCAKAGWHVLCEKPLGMDLRQAQEMESACRSAGVLLGVGLMMRFHSQHQAALDLINTGRLGMLTCGRAQLSCWYPPMQGAWRQTPSQGGGGSLMDMGGHCIDLLEMFFGPVKRVSCFINNTVHDYESEDSAVATLFFHNGAIATVDTFFCIPDNSSKNSLEIYGTKGSILATGTIGQGDAGEMTAYLEDDQRGYESGQAREDLSGMPIKPEAVNTYCAEITEFSQAILDSREPLNCAALGIRNQQVLAACYESALSGSAVEITGP